MNCPADRGSVRNDLNATWYQQHPRKKAAPSNDEAAFVDLNHIFKDICVPIAERMK
jgi:hypothetical protein